jgi:hypothetical protein
MSKSRIVARIKAVVLVCALLWGGSVAITGCTLTTIRDNMVAGGLSAIKGYVDTTTKTEITKFITAIFPGFGK